MENAHNATEDERRLRRQLAALEARQNHLLRIMDEETLGLVFVDRELQVVEVSDAFAVTFGLASGETFPSQLAPLAAAIRGVLSTGQASEEDLAWPSSPCPQHGAQRIRLACEPWRSPAGDLLGASVLARCIPSSSTGGLPDLDLSDLLRLLPHGVVVSDAEGIITHSNPAHARMHGRAVGELIGTPVWELVEPDSQEAIKEYVFDIIEHQPEPTVFESAGKKPDGTPFFKRVDWDYLRDARGEIMGFLSVVTETTERKKMRASLDDSEKRLRNAKRLAGLGSWEWDVVESTVSCSEELCRIIGRPGQEPWTADVEEFLEFVHPDDRPQLRRRLEDAVESSSSFQMEVRVLHPSGDEVYVQALGEVVRDVHGNVRMLQGTAQDTSLFRQTESQRRLLRELDHRVKNNLSMILGLLHLTAESHQALDDFLESFQARVFSMAALHEALATRSWTGLSIADIVTTAIGPLRANCTLDGPTLEVSARIAIPLGLALHELATNAQRHGQINGSGGALRVSWSVDAQSAEISLRWTEVGGRPGSQGPNDGIGLSLLRTLVEHEIGGAATLCFSEDGARHTLSFSIGDPCECS